MSAAPEQAGQPGRLRGLSLVELMVAMTLGLLLMSGLVLVYLESRRQSLLEAEGARLQQSGRYALSLLQHELVMAGFFGRLAAPALTSALAPGLASVPGAPGCGALAGWALLPEPALDFILDIAGTGRRTVHGHELGCLPAGGAAIVGATDVLVVKRSAAQATLQNGVFAPGLASAEASQWYLRSAGGTADWRYLARGDSVPAEDRRPGSGVSYWEAYASIFFVRPWSQPGDGVPALCVERLSANSMGPAECLVEGVEDLQFSVGIDRDGDGYVERFTNHPGAADLPKARLVRVALLMRSLGPVPGSRRGPGATSGSAGAAGAASSGGLDGDGYLRRWFSSTVPLRNLNPPAPVRRL
ncbi:PilW family protein [Parahaliea mediterranea]|uniref:PilW family protein n=1 Tax=Parahaliea mediterranea TaxID=651086 RepID=UPI000E2F66A8|nr:PilW family protein [Parahaliea mediterranea]